MVKKSLQAWCNNGDINSNQKEIIKKFGVSDYYPEREVKDFKKLWYWDEILNRNKWKISIPGRIEKMIFFSADWNNNLLLVANEKVVNDKVDVNLIIYEMPIQGGDDPAEGKLRKFLVGSYSGSYNALNQARELVSKLKYNSNPILAFCDRSSDLFFITINYERDYSSSCYPMTFEKNMVERIELPSETRNNPDRYIKPLDIVLVINSDMVHSCVYLGDKKVCHVIAPNRLGIVKIDSWSNFFGIIHVDKILCYHPVIAFKKPDIVIRHISKSIEGTGNYFLPGVKNVSGNFSIMKR